MNAARPPREQAIAAAFGCRVRFGLTGTVAA